MAKLNLESISNYMNCLTKELDKQLSDNGYVILELGPQDVDSDKVTEEVIKELKKNYVVNYTVARTSAVDHYIIVITKDSYLSMYIEDEVLDLLYKDITDEVDKTTEENYHYWCDINIYSTLDLNLYRGIAMRLEEYKNSYNLNVHLDGKHGDNPRKLEVRWNKDWVHDYYYAKWMEFEERERWNNPLRYQNRLTGSDIMHMASGEFYLINGPIIV
jgi:hypothetical protein